MPLAGDVGRHLHAIGEPHAGDLADSGVRLPRRLCGHLRADPAFERRRIKGRTILERIKTACQGGHGRLGRFVLASSLGELVDGCHEKKKTREGSQTI